MNINLPKKGGKPESGLDITKKVVVAVKALKEIPGAALVWVLTHVVQPGDCITLLVVVPSHNSDPYLNTDAGTMSPFENEEVLVLDDGGKVVPHITDAIQEWIECVVKIPVDGQEGKKAQRMSVSELVGTIGDIESMPFIEALGQFSYRVGPGNFCLVHISLVPVLNVVGEQVVAHVAIVANAQTTYVAAKAHEFGASWIILDRWEILV